MYRSLVAGLCGLILTGVGRLEAQRSEAKDSAWIPAWAASASELQPRFNVPVTFRNVVHLSVGGSQLRVRVTNELGPSPLEIAAVSVSVPGVQKAVGLPVTFSGRSSVEVPAGSYLVSDPVEVRAAALTEVAVDVFVAHPPATGATCHAFAGATTFVSAGDATGGQGPAPDAVHIGSWCYLKSVDVLREEPSAALVAFGDSITDGDRSTLNSNHRWPDVLSTRLQGQTEMRGVAVLNKGIGGNRLLHNDAGPNALARFERDVLAVDGVKWVILLEGINDLGHSNFDRSPTDPVTAEELIAAFTQMALRAHSHGIKVYGGTILADGGAGYFTPEGERKRQMINRWIRQTRVFDGVADFDAVTRDPQHPESLNPLYDSGDHLHPNDAGYKAMGESIPLAWFSQTQ